MAISFDAIPSGTRVPVFQIEINSSLAQQGPAIQQYEALIIGQRLAAGTKPAQQVDRVTSADQAKLFYGNGSMVAQMVERFLAQNPVTPLSVVSLDDDGAAVAAAGDVTFSGTSTEAGTLVLYVGGRRYTVAIPNTTAAAAIPALALAVINADTDRVVDAADGTGGVLDLTARNAGAVGNEIDIRLNYFQGEELPAGLSAVVNSMGGGTTNPDIGDAISALDTEKQYHIWAHPYTDGANLTALETELADRFGPLRQLDGHAFVGKRDSFANLVSLGDGRNSPHNSIVASLGPNSPWEHSAAIAGVVALAGQADPARPFQTLPLSGLLAPDDTERFTFSERDMLLKDGIATTKADSGGVIRLERMITTYQENSLGAPDTAFLDVNTLLTISYLRFSLRVRFLLRFPRSKLANDGTNFGPGQNVVTPLIAKSEVIALFREWEELGLVENFDQFKRDLIVERNSSDPNRLDFLLPPDFVNQFRIGAAQIAFRL